MFSAITRQSINSRHPQGERNEIFILMRGSCRFGETLDHPSARQKPRLWEAMRCFQSSRHSSPR
jgi:hypothetical protein